MPRQRDTAVIAKAIAPVIRGFVAKAVDAVAERLAAIEQAIAELPSGKDGQPGASAYDAAVSLGFEGSVYDWMDSLVGKQGSPGQRGEPGLAGSPGPPGDPGKEGTPGHDGADGESVTVDDVLPALMAHVDEFLQHLRTPVDGQDGAPGKDGADGKSVTLEEVYALMAPKIAEWELDFERRAQGALERSVDRLPKPKNGKDGRDALDLEHFELSLGDDDRTMTLSLIRGETTVSRSIRMPTVMYRGVWSPDESYQRHDSVTFGGSQWIAMVEKPEGKPGQSKDWKLSVKCGRDGKPGRDGKSEPKKKGSEQ